MKVEYTDQFGSPVPAPQGPVVLSDNTDNPRGRGFRTMAVCVRFLRSPEKWGSGYCHQIRGADGRLWELYDLSGAPPTAWVRLLDE